MRALATAGTYERPRSTFFRQQRDQPAAPREPHRPVVFSNRLAAVRIVHLQVVSAAIRQNHHIGCRAQPAAKVCRPQTLDRAGLILQSALPWTTHPPRDGEDSITPHIRYHQLAVERNE